MIGIDENSRLVYEGDVNRGYGVWPSPFVTPAHIVESDSDLDKIHPGPDPARAALVYREDSFDPVTRVRRGRFYQRPESTPQEWACEPHPARPLEANYRSAASPEGWHFKRIFGFREWPASVHLNSRKKSVALGFKDAFTLWRVISVERMITGDDLVTLQARSRFGVITEIDESKLPDKERGHVIRVVDKVVDAANRAGPESIIDRCRDAAQVLIGMQYEKLSGDPSWKTEDLGKQIRRLQNSENFGNQIIVRNSASIIARLHARKPNELAERNLRALVDDDALLAMQCLSALIREMGLESG